MMYCYRAHLDSLLKYIDEGVKEGGNLVYGGKRLPRPGIITLITSCFHLLVYC